MNLLKTVIDELKTKHGSLRAAGRAVQVDPSYMKALADGKKENPSASTLRALGLKAVTIYKRLGE